VTARLAELKARRARLQLECAVQRQAVGVLYHGIEHKAGRADRVLGVVRSYAPLIAVGGVAMVLIVGPGRMLGLLRRALPIAVSTTQVMSLLR
jgi:hypothetical protein